MADGYVSMQAGRQAGRIDPVPGAARGAAAAAAVTVTDRPSISSHGVGVNLPAPTIRRQIIRFDSRHSTD